MVEFAFILIKANESGSTPGVSALSLFSALGGEEGWKFFDVLDDIFIY